MWIIFGYSEVLGPIRELDFISITLIIVPGIKERICRNSHKPSTIELSVSSVPCSALEFKLCCFSLSTSLLGSEIVRCF